MSEYVLTDKYIYVAPVKEQRVVQFDRKGRFIRTLIPFGQGPGEISSILAGMQADEENNRLYLFNVNCVGVYTLDGEFIRNLDHEYSIVYQRKVDGNRLASVAFPYVPFQEGSYGLGVFTMDGDTVVTKNDFSSPLVPAEKAGFTVSLAAGYSGSRQSVLFKAGCNDTVFRLSAEGIKPACVLRLHSSDKEIIRSLDATDFSSLHQKPGTDGEIFVSDLFETPRSYYFRCRYKEGHFVASVNKDTGEVLAEECVQPEDIRILSDANLLFGMLGTRSYRQFPVWGRTEGKELVQLVTSYELGLYRGQSGVSVPQELEGVNEDSNPVFIIYKLRED